MKTSDGKYLELRSNDTPESFFQYILTDTIKNAERVSLWEAVSDVKHEMPHGVVGGKKTTLDTDPNIDRFIIKTLENAGLTEGAMLDLEKYSEEYPKVVKIIAGAVKKTKSPAELYKATKKAAELIKEALPRLYQKELEKGTEKEQLAAKILTPLKQNATDKEKTTDATVRLIISQAYSNAQNKKHNEEHPGYVKAGISNFFPEELAVDSTIYNLLKETVLENAECTKEDIVKTLSDSLTPYIDQHPVVVDSNNKAVGMITQDDLRRGSKLPERTVPIIGLRDGTINLPKGRDEFSGKPYYSFFGSVESRLKESLNAAAKLIERKPTIEIVITPPSSEVSSDTDRSSVGSENGGNLPGSRISGTKATRHSPEKSADIGAGVGGK